MDKTFYITYWASKHKKHNTRKGKHDEKSRYGTSKQGVPYYVYYDLDSHGTELQLQHGKWGTNGVVFIRNNF